MKSNWRVFSIYVLHWIDVKKKIENVSIVYWLIGKLKKNVVFSPWHSNSNRLFRTSEIIRRAWIRTKPICFNLDHTLTGQLSTHERNFHIMHSHWLKQQPTIRNHMLFMNQLFFPFSHNSHTMPFTLNSLSHSFVKISYTKFKAVLNGSHELRTKKQEKK